MVTVLTKILVPYIIIHVLHGAILQNTPNVTLFKFILISGQNESKTELHTFTYYKMSIYIRLSDLFLEENLYSFKVLVK